MQPPALSASNSAAVIGGGVGGLACAIRLAAAGMKVNLFESHGHLGGKIRTIDSAAGPVDAGPTVLTMRHVFDDLFAAAGQRLEDHVTLVPQPTLARHFWADGSTLDLHADKDANIAAVTDFAGAKAAQQFQAFCDRCAKLFDAFDAPMMQSASPSLMELSRHVMARPSLIPAMAPLSSLAGMLKRQFDDPRLQQLFGRYATYVGGSPLQSPALLALIWQAEAAGVWVVEGGMHKLAEAMGHVAQDLGVEIHLDTPVARIEHQGGRATGIVLEDGTRQAADKVVFNGDPRALATGLLGQGTAHLAPKSVAMSRSLSARVHSFAATPSGPDLAHHNVLFADEPNSEFKDIKAGKAPSRRQGRVQRRPKGLGNRVARTRHCPSRPQKPHSRSVLVGTGPQLCGNAYGPRSVAPQCVVRGCAQQRIQRYQSRQNAKRRDPLHLRRRQRHRCATARA